jgi:hypothetical protein
MRDGSAIGPSGGRDAGPDSRDGSAMPRACRGGLPSTSLITGSPTSPAGPVYSFAEPNIALPQWTPLISSDGLRTGLQVLWAPGPIVGPGSAYAGFGLAFTIPPCVDARVFTGVRFTVSGDLGTCALQFGVVPSEDNAVANSPYASCVAGAMCLPPLSGSIGVGTTVVRFSEMIGGSPLATPDPATLNAVNWTLTAPAGAAGCQANITVSDVAFVLDNGDAMPPPCPTSPGNCADEGATCALAPAGCTQRLACVGGGWVAVPCAQ